MGVAVRSLLVLVATVLTFQSYAGTEVPWPYSAQQPITAEESQGLWWVHTEKGPILLNIEIFDGKHISWMRVTEMDTWDYTIRTYGEGYYCDHSEENEGRDGRFVRMFSQDKEYDPYLLKLVQVDMGWGVVIGVSIYRDGEAPDHILGYRQSKEPLNCYYPSNSKELVCDPPKPD